MSSTPHKSWERAATLPHRLPATDTPAPATPQSPRAPRKRFPSVSDDSIIKVNGTGEGPCMGDWEAFKQEMLREVRSQVTAMKNEIIDAIKMELARR